MSDKPVTTDAEVIEANVVRPRRRSGLYLMVAAVLLTLLAAVALWQSVRLVRQVDDRISAATGASAAELRARIDDINQRIEAAVNAGSAADTVKQEVTQQISSLNEKQAAMQQQVNAAIANLAGSPSRQDSGWVLAEARHLLGIAEQRLRLERDVATAIVAAESVDRRLADSNDPSLIPIREQVIADISALRAVPVVDVAGISLTLSSLIDRIEELPLKGGDPLADAAAIQSSPAAEPGPATEGWRGAVAQIWTDLLGLVDVKTAAVPDDVIFDPEKRYLLQQGLRLELAAARLDALRGATDSFHSAIGRIDTQLDRYFDTQSQPVMAARESLAPLRSVELAPPLPGFEKSLQLLAAQQSALEAAPNTSVRAPADLTPAPAAAVELPASGGAEEPTHPGDATPSTSAPAPTELAPTPAAAADLPAADAVDDPAPTSDAEPGAESGPATPETSGGVELDPESGLPVAPEPPDPNLTRPLDAAPTLVP
jgi:uroporphyrin-III C-methyltransferase